MQMQYSLLCSIIFFLFLACLTIYLAQQPIEPICYISSFNVIPTPNQIWNNNATSSHYNSTTNVSFKVGFINQNLINRFGITNSHIDFTANVFVDYNTTRQIGKSTVGGFYQATDRDFPNTMKQGSIKTRGGALNGTLKVDGKMYIRLDFTTWVKYDLLGTSNSRPYRLWGGANVAVNGSGVKDEKDGILLRH